VLDEDKEKNFTIPDVTSASKRTIVPAAIAADVSWVWTTGQLNPEFAVEVGSTIGTRVGTGVYVGWLVAKAVGLTSVPGGVRALSEAH
jgi:hypothetical protein